jgi:hypothetical protein
MVYIFFAINQIDLYVKINRSFCLKINRSTNQG